MSKVDSLIVQKAQEAISRLKKAHARSLRHEYSETSVALTALLETWRELQNELDRVNEQLKDPDVIAAVGTCNGQHEKAIIDELSAIDSQYSSKALFRLAEILMGACTGGASELVKVIKDIVEKRWVSNSAADAELLFEEFIQDIARRRGTLVQALTDGIRNNEPLPKQVLSEKSIQAASKAWQARLNRIVRDNR